MNKATKDKLRSLTLGKASKFKRQTVTIDGVDFEIKQPSVKERGKIQKAAMTFTDEKSMFDLSEFMLLATLNLVVVPGTDERVFEDSDRESIENLPAGSWYDELSKVAAKICNVNAEDEEAVGKD